MAMQTYGLSTGRIEKYKGLILKHSQPFEILAKAGENIPMPRNNSRTYVARRWLPFNAAATNVSTQNRYIQNGTGNRDIAVAQAHQIAEGVTPVPDSVTTVDITVVLQQYGCVYGYTDVVSDLYEDDIPAAMIEQCGERIAFVNEMIIYGALRQCTNVYYGGSGTSVATVNGGLTLGLLRNIAKGLAANGAKMVNKMLKAGPNFGTDAVGEGYLVYVSTDLEPDIRDLPNFTPTERYASGTALPNEIGKCERFRFIGHKDLPAVQDGGAAVATYPGYISTSSTNMDVYPILVVAQDAWGQIALRGKDSAKINIMRPGDYSKSDILGQRGYIGAIWWKAVMIKNGGWMAVANVAARSLT